MVRIPFSARRDAADRNAHDDTDQRGKRSPGEKQRNWSRPSGRDAWHQLVQGRPIAATPYIARLFFPPSRAPSRIDSSRSTSRLQTEKTWLMLRPGPRATVYKVVSGQD